MANDYGSMARYYDLLYAKTDDISFYSEFVNMRESPILEIASGTGRLLIEIARWGKEVYGLELEPKMINIAKQKISREDVNVQHRIRFVTGDMRTHSLDIKFNLIITAFSVLREISRSEDRQAVIRNAFEMLNPGGILIIDNNNGIARKDQRPFLEFIKKFKDELTNDTVSLFEANKWNNELKVNEHHIFVDRLSPEGFLKREEYLLALNYISHEETFNQLKSVGLGQIDLYSDYMKTPFDWGNIMVNKRQIFVAIKEG